MRTKVSTKGQIVLPQALRETLGLRPGDELLAELEGDRIILIPQQTRSAKARLSTDPTTGLPVLTSGKQAAPLTSEQVARVLADFP
jgi:AbrB family looped-hinge helix DNA binding protein